VVIATKFGFDLSGGDKRPGAAGLDSRPEHIKQAVEGSLQRLKIDTIDLLYQHRVDPNVPIEDVAGAVKDLIQGGQGQALWPFRKQACRPSAARTRSQPGHRALQSEYSLWWRSRKRRYWPTLEELRIGFVPFSPLARVSSRARSTKY